MLKSASLALALAIGATAMVPAIASAGDTGPCDHCTMEPIVVKGERPKKKKTETSAQPQLNPQPGGAGLSQAPAPLAR
ncbi:MAG: hypothetical protein VX871_08165 [Pseudomonadota bacterium]|nr:hypothetical protein [Pseudomonadota bacterium]